MDKSRLYTRTGDSGTTSLVGGQRIAKHAPRLEAYGTIDELNSWIGLVAATATPLPPSAHTSLWTTIQSRLFDIGSYLATDPDGQWAAATANPVTEADVALLEGSIDAVDSLLPSLQSFVLPQGTVGSCNAHVARTVCRRAERRVCALAEAAPVDPLVLRYINRVSDLLFAVARFNNVNTGTDEIFWTKGC